MQKRLLIIKNVPREGAGLLETILKERRIDFDIADLDTGAESPAPKNYQGIVVLGGPDSANDQTPKMRKELEQVQEALKLQIPYLGICLGLQVLVKAAGGKVYKNPLKEIGFIAPDGHSFTVELTSAGQKDPLFKGLPDPFQVFQLHGETVEITKGMELLATGKFCQNQVVRIGKNAYGIQCHFELTPEMFERWLNEDNDLKIMNKEELYKNFKNIEKEYTVIGKQLLNNFLEIAKFA